MIESDAISRAGTMERSLNQLDSVNDLCDEAVTHNWALRPVVCNDFFLRHTFSELLKSSAQAKEEDRLVMYDACDEHEIKQSVGVFRKRLDARRNTKPKKPDQQMLVCTPFNPMDFNFSKIRNHRERLTKLQLQSGRYELLTNKFPLFAGHMLLVAEALVPQQMTLAHLTAITDLLGACSFSAYFNSWCASASVNHFHCHLIDELPPVTNYPLVAGAMVNGTRCLLPKGFPGFCYVFEVCHIALVDEAIRAMQADNQPHNLLFTPRYIYIFPKPLARPERSFDLYPETVGGPELIGSFTVYRNEDYASLSEQSVEELCRINTAPLPSRLLQRGGTGSTVDDAALDFAVSRGRAPLPSSRSMRIPRGIALVDECGWARIVTPAA